MSRSSKEEAAAIAAVARRYCATWERRDRGRPGAYLTIAGEPIAVDVVAIDRGIAQRGDLTEPRLRFDRVALRFVRRLQGVLSGSVPDGEAVILTVTAPIRLPAKTAAELESKIGDWLARRAARGGSRRRSAAIMSGSVM